MDDINENKGKRHVLVAGGAGFIGSHLCEYLLRRGDRVTCLDNFRTGHPGNVSALADNPCFRLVTHDITIPYAEDGIDEIYNLACPASPVHYQADPVATTKASVIGTLNLLELARENRCKFLQASTSEVYGDPVIHPQPESYWGYVNPNGIRSCYDEGKRCAESLCMDYHRMYGVAVKIIRIFNTYGPRMACDDGRVVPNFILQALQGKDLTIYGDGKQTRSFQYVDDLIRGMELMMATPDDFTGPVNMGNPEEHTVQDFAAAVIRLTGSKSQITYMPLPADDPARRKPDITLARGVLGWVPQVSLHEGLSRTIGWYRGALREVSREAGPQAGKQVRRGAKHAVLVIAYHHADFIRRCMDNFDDDFLFFIHWDKKSELTEADRAVLAGHPRVAYLGQEYPVNWASYGIVRATLLLCRKAMEYGDVGYFHLVSDADMPVRDAARFKDFFKEHDGESFMEYGRYDSWSGTFDEPRFQKMTLFHRTEKYDLRVMSDKELYDAELKEQMESGNRRPLPDVPVYGGAAWWSLARECVACLLEHEDFIERYYTDTFLPDEMFAQTVLMNSPFAATINGKDLRYICWEHRNGNRPAVLDLDDFGQISGGEYFFARKIDPEGVSKGLVCKVDEAFLHGVLTRDG